MLRQQSFASVVMSLPMLRALSQCLASTATGARSACSALGQLSAGPQWSSACSLLQQSPSISVESSQACRHVRFDGAWGSACTRAWSSQTTTASPSQTSNPEPTPNISQPAQPSPSAPSTAEPTPQPTAAGVEASEGTPQSAAGAATAAAAAQPVAPAAQQKKETIQAIRARVFGEPILPGKWLIDSYSAHATLSVKAYGKWVWEMRNLVWACGCSFDSCAFPTAHALYCYGAAE